MIFSFFKRSKPETGKAGGREQKTHGFTHEQIVRIQSLAHERLERAETLAIRTFKPEAQDTGA